MFLQFCPLQVAEGENHTLIERRDELNATMMEQVKCHPEHHHDHHNDEAGLHQGDGWVGNCLESGEREQHRNFCKTCSMTFRNYCQVSVTVCHKYHLSFRRCTKQNSITKATNGRSFQLTPLFLACWAKKPEAALILLEEGADPNILALQVWWYIYYDAVSVCLCVTKNHHFLLGVSCDHLNYP